MEPQYKKRSAFSGKIGFVLSAAGASVGLGNIWRFPYLAAKYGGGIFLLIYILLAFTFGYTMIVAETALGRMTKKSPVGAFAAFGKKGGLSFGGWINAIIPILIVPYYSVIGGWVIRYLAEYIAGHGKELATGGYFSSFISNGASAEICFVIFTIFTLAIIPLAFQYEIVDGFTGLGQVQVALPLSFFRKGLYFVSLFLLPAMFGAEAAFFAEPVSDIAGPVVSAIVYIVSMKGILAKAGEN